MSLIGSKKGHDGFNVIVEVLDDAIELHLIVISGNKYSHFARSSVKHRLHPENGLSQVEVDKFVEVLSKGFALLAEEAIKIAGEKIKIKIKGAKAIIYSPWYSLETKNDVKLGKSGELVTVKQANIESLLEDTLSSTLPDSNPITAYTYKKTVIEAFINSVKLNGYIVPNPIGKKAKEVSVSASLYTASAVFLKSLKKTIHYHSGVEPITFTFPKACALFTMQKKQNTPALFVDVENEGTSLTLVEGSEGHIYLTAESDYGLNQIMKKVVEKSGTEQEIAHSYMRLMDEMLLTDNAAIVVKSAVDEALEVWKSKVQDSLRIITDSLSSYSNSGFTSKIILCRDPRLTNIFVNKMNGAADGNKEWKSELLLDKVVFESVSAPV